MPSMSDPKAKIGWAKKHLERLDAELLSFCTPVNAYTITRYDDVENGWHIAKIELSDIPPRICLIAGDAIYNMRSALDQLVWALARLSGIPPHTQFPIIEVWTADAKKRFERQICGVPDAAFCEIQALQPYHRGDAFKSHPLWRLDEMCNLDKHRRIPAHGTAIDGTMYGFDVADSVSESCDDCFIVKVPIARKDKFGFNPKLPITVTFGGDISGITETFESILQIHNFITLNVLPRFERFFP
jgi:hypothetical protein